MDFMFDGEKLSDRGYSVCYDGTQDEELAVSSMVYETIKASLSDVVHKVAHNYEENYTRTFAVMKSPCDNDDYIMSEEDVSEMTRWLVRKQYKIFRYIDEEGEPYPTWYKVQNTVSKIIYGEQIIGLTITVNSNAPYGFSDENVISWDEENTELVTVESDEEGYIYPDMTITVLEDGNLLITNDVEDGRVCLVKNVTADEVITITGGDIQQISSSNDEHDLSVDFNYVFPRLVTTYGNYENNITVNLASEKELRYCGIRKVGL